MKKIIKIAAVVFAAAVIAITAYELGRVNGINHMLGDSYFTVGSLGTFTEPDGSIYDASLIIELDGEMYEQGLTLFGNYDF